LTISGIELLTLYLCTWYISVKFPCYAIGILYFILLTSLPSVS
jgi:hypothetical protein